jgi:DNA-directed RNA polymerase subunit RPC12/RpoP
LERAVYICPFCGFSRFESQGNEITCTTCGRKITYGEDKTLTGVGFDFPFRYVAQWYDYQKDYVNQTDLTACTAQPFFREPGEIWDVQTGRKKTCLRAQAQLCLYGDRLTVDEGAENALILPFADIQAAAVLGRNKLNIYTKDRVYQFRGGKRFNALKYVHFYHRHRNLIRGDANGEFLGL